MVLFSHVCTDVSLSTIVLWLRCKIHHDSMYVCIYVWTMTYTVVMYCMAGGRVVYHILLYGRVGLLTLFFSVIGAPLSRRRVTVLSLPLRAAPCRAVSPSYNRDIQTNKQTDSNRLGRYAQTG